MLEAEDVAIAGNRFPRGRPWRPSFGTKQLTEHSTDLWVGIRFGRSSFRQEFVSVALGSLLSAAVPAVVFSATQTAALENSGIVAAGEEKQSTVKNVDRATLVLPPT